MRLPPEGTLLGGPEAVSLKPEFPYGLRIELDEDALRLLNMSDLPEAGSSMMLHAKVFVAQEQERIVEGKGKVRNLTLQITDMDLEGGNAPKDQAQLIYMEDS